jgi:CRP/FNR family cyclic AMP-dependent transcriptional regulator
MSVKMVCSGYPSQTPCTAFLSCRPASLALSYALCMAVLNGPAICSSQGCATRVRVTTGHGIVWCSAPRRGAPEGAVKLSVRSHSGKEAVVAMLGPGDFFGERALAGHPVRLEAATALTATRVLVVPKQQMIRVLHDQHAFSDRFITYMLARNIRIEEDLVDQLFNSSERRLARTLLLLARYGKPEQTHRVLPRISQETLAEMIGTTRSRVNFFMNKFKKLGFIEYNGGLKVNHSLLTVILHDG